MSLRFSHLRRNLLPAAFMNAFCMPTFAFPVPVLPVRDDLRRSFGAGLSKGSAAAQDSDANLPKNYVAEDDRRALSWISAADFENSIEFEHRRRANA